MYAFLIGNNNNDLNRGYSTRRRERKLENTNFLIKKKIEIVKKFNPNSCYISSSDEDEIKTITNNKIILNNNENESRLNNKSNEAIKRILSFKRGMKVLDMILFVIVMFGFILCHAENEIYYENNKNERVQGIYLMNFLLNNNLSDMINYSSVSNKSVFDLLFNNNVTNFTVDFLSNINDFSKFSLVLNVPDECDSIRYLILLTTIIAIINVISKKIEYTIEYSFKFNRDFKFFIETDIFYIFIIETIIMMLFPFPGMKNAIIYVEMGNYICYPYSSIFTAISIFRFYFILKFFKHLTKYTNKESEEICEKNFFKANTKFAFKSVQKDNPFVILSSIFILTCLGFGLSLRIFERYYWETKDSKQQSFQNWEYIWNSMWCIFVAMTTVGYGDFYPSTHLGRFICIMGCIVGIYFVSMMMVFMTQQSLLKDNEYKSFRLLIRLNAKNELKSIYSLMIYHCLKLKLHKEQIEKAKITEKEFNIAYNREKQSIYDLMLKIKSFGKLFASIDSSTEDHLLAISNKIDHDFKELEKEIHNLRELNSSLRLFLDSQIEIATNIKKTCYSTKMLYSIIESESNMFGNLQTVDFTLKNLFETNVNNDIDDTFKSINAIEESPKLIAKKSKVTFKSNDDEKEESLKLRSKKTKVAFKLINTKEESPKLLSKKTKVEFKSNDDIEESPKLLSKNTKESPKFISKKSKVIHKNTFKNKRIGIPDNKTIVENKNKGNSYFSEDNLFFKNQEEQFSNPIKDSISLEEGSNNNDSEESSDYDENIYKYDINPIQVKEHFSFLFDKFKKRGTRKNNHHLVKMFHNENLK